MCKTPIIKITYRYDGAVIIEREEDPDLVGTSDNEEVAGLYPARFLPDRRRALLSTLALERCGFVAADNTLVRSNEPLPGPR